MKKTTIRKPTKEKLVELAKLKLRPGGAGQASVYAGVAERMAKLPVPTKTGKAKAIVVAPFGKHDAGTAVKRLTTLANYRNMHPKGHRFSFRQTTDGKVAITLVKREKRVRRTFEKTKVAPVKGKLANVVRRNKTKATKTKK